MTDPFIRRGFKGIAKNRVKDPIRLGEATFVLDMDIFSYSISEVGIYKLLDTLGTNLLSFPDPNKFEGQSITIIGSSTSPADTLVNNANGFAPIDATGAVLPIISYKHAYVFKSIYGAWYQTSFG